MRTRLTRRGSASSTWNSKPGTAWTTSPRAGTRPSVLKIMPPIVSTVSPCSPAENASPIDLGDLVDLGLAVDHEDAVAGLGDQRLVLVVMLVLDIADHHLDDVFQRDQPVGAAIFVDDQRHLRARRLHARHQVGGQHRGRHEQHGRWIRPSSPIVLERSTLARLSVAGELAACASIAWLS